MASEELRKRWKRTEGFLRGARSHFPEAMEEVCADQFREFEEYLELNELELALDMLEAATDRAGIESFRALELMAMAAANMGLIDRQRAYDKRLSDARGWKYDTQLPP